MRATVRNLPRGKRPERRHGDGARAGRFRRAIFTMRPEEVMTMILFVPVAVALAGVSANLAAYPVDPAAAGYPSAAARLLALVATVALTLWVVRTKPRWELARDSLQVLLGGVGVDTLLRSRRDRARA